MRKRDEERGGEGKREEPIGRERRRERGVEKEEGGREEGGGECGREGEKKFRFSHNIKLCEILINYPMNFDVNYRNQFCRVSEKITIVRKFYKTFFRCNLPFSAVS